MKKEKERRKEQTLLVSDTLYIYIHKYTTRREWLSERTIKILTIEGEERKFLKKSEK